MQQNNKFGIGILLRDLILLDKTVLINLADSITTSLEKTEFLLPEENNDEIKYKYLIANTDNYINVYIGIHHGVKSALLNDVIFPDMKIIWFNIDEYSKDEMEKRLKQWMTLDGCSKYQLLDINSTFNVNNFVEF